MSLKVQQEHADDHDSGPVEIALVGDLTDRVEDLSDKLLEIPPGGNCILYFDSPGGSPYSALAILSLIRLRGLRATGIVIGECSSAMLWPFAACGRRLVTTHSVLLFHPMRWQSESNVGLAEAAEWARHFEQLEQDMDQLLADLFQMPLVSLNEWLAPGRYVTGQELAERGLAEVIDLSPLPWLLEATRDDDTR